MPANTMRGVTFIGMSGSGKSSVGKALAKKLGWKFFDLDTHIFEREAATHHEIMERAGEDALTALELRYTLEADFNDVVFAPGGSIVYSPSAMDKVKNETTVVYLRTEPATIERHLGVRLHQNGIVGLEEKGLAGVMAERAPLYAQYADVTLDADEDSVNAMALRTLAALGELRSDIKVPYAIS